MWKQKQDWISCECGGRLTTGGGKTSWRLLLLSLSIAAVLLASFSPAEQDRPVSSSGSSPTSPKIPPAPNDAFKTPCLPTKRRRRSARSTTPSERSSPSAQEGRAKRRRKANVPSQPVSAAKEWAELAGADSTSTPLQLRAPRPCPSTVTKGRVPLATSAAQNCSTPLAPRGLNATFDLGENPCPVTIPEFPAWESKLQFPNLQGEPFIPR